MKYTFKLALLGFNKRSQKSCFIFPAHEVLLFLSPTDFANCWLTRFPGWPCDRFVFKLFLRLSGIGAPRTLPGSESQKLSVNTVETMLLQHFNRLKSVLGMGVGQGLCSCFIR